MGNDTFHTASFFFWQLILEGHWLFVCRGLRLNKINKYFTFKTRVACHSLRMTEKINNYMKTAVVLTYFCRDGCNGQKAILLKNWISLKSMKAWKSFFRSAYKVSRVLSILTESNSKTFGLIFANVSQKLSFNKLISRNSHSNPS